MLEKEAAVVDKLESSIVRIENKLDDRNGFQSVSKGSKVETDVSSQPSSSRYWKMRVVMSLTSY